MAVAVGEISSQETFGQLTLSSDTDQSIVVVGIPSAATFGVLAIEDTTPHIEIAGSVILSVSYMVGIPTEAVSVFSNSANTVSISLAVVNTISAISASAEFVSILCEAIDDNT